MSIQLWTLLQYQNKSKCLQLFLSFTGDLLECGHMNRHACFQEGKKKHITYHYKIYSKSYYKFFLSIWIQRWSDYLVFQSRGEVCTMAPLHMHEGMKDHPLYEQSLLALATLTKVRHSQSVSQSVRQSISQSVSRSVGRSVCRSVSQSVSQSFIHSFSQSVSLSI